MDERPKSNYFLEWFQAVPARWYAMIPILIALLGGTAAAIIWVSDKGLAWWWILLYAVIVILFIVFSYLAYRKTAVFGIIKGDRFKPLVGPFVLAKNRQH